MAMKCVAQMPQPVATPAVKIQVTRARPRPARARLNRLMAVRLARKQSAPARTTSRKSCSTVRQERTRYMFGYIHAQFVSRTLVTRHKQYGKRRGEGRW